MQIDRGEIHSPAQWFLIACGGDLVLKLAHDLSLGEDCTGDLVLNPPEEESLVRVSLEDDHVALKVSLLNMTLAVGGERSVQYLAIDEDRAVRIRLPNNTVSLTTNFAGDGGDVDFLDVAMRRAALPSITGERMALTGEHEVVPDTGNELDDLIGPIVEVDVIRDEDYGALTEPESAAEPEPEAQAETDVPASASATAPPSKEAGRRGSRVRLVAMILLGLAGALLALPLAE
jgi:hypothetical protein